MNTEIENCNNNIITRAKINNTPFAILKIYVPDNLKIKYTEAIKEHNNKMEKNIYPDSGFDLYIPDNFNVSENGFGNSNGFLFNEENNSFKIDFEIKCEMQTFTENGMHNIPSAFFLFPRSSISKTPIRLANSIGLIDSGYRGNIIAVFDYKNSTIPFELKKYDRIVQIVHPSTYRIFVELVDELTDSERGIGAFGSTEKESLIMFNKKEECLHYLDTVPPEIKMNL